MALIHKLDPTKSGKSPLVPPDLSARDSIADTLRLARQEHGQDLRTVAQVLRIRLAYLEAIEKGDFEQLPGTAYAIGFLRTYAEFLGLDGESIVERYKREVQGAEPKLDLVFPEPVGQNRIPGGAVVLISMVLLGLAYGGWLYLSNEGKSIADLMPPLPERLQAMLSGDDDGRKDNGQDAVTPGSETVALETAALESDGTPGDAPLVYSPPESAETESQVPSETAVPAIAADIEPPAPPAPTELVVQDVAVPDTALAADFEVVQDVVAVPEAAPVPVPETVETTEAPVPEIVETTEAPVPETRAETAEAAEPLAPLAPPAQPAPAAAVELQHSAATDNSFLTLTAGAGPTHQGTTDSAGSVEPMLDETVVIPAPPTATRDLVVSTERLPRVYGESNRGTRIVLRAVQDSWVQVRDRQDALLLTRVLRDGDTYYVPSQEGLTLLTGNAGGIVIEVDGVALAPLGPIGTVRRQIALDPVRLLDGTAQVR